MYDEHITFQILGNWYLSYLLYKMLMSHNGPKMCETLIFTNHYIETDQNRNVHTNDIHCITLEIKQDFVDVNT